MMPAVIQMIRMGRARGFTVDPTTIQPNGLDFTHDETGAQGSFYVNNYITREGEATLTMYYTLPGTRWNPPDVGEEPMGTFRSLADGFDFVAWLAKADAHYEWRMACQMEEGFIADEQRKYWGMDS